MTENEQTTTKEVNPLEEPGFLELIHKVYLRIKTVKIANFLLLVLALKPLLFKLYIATINDQDLLSIHFKVNDYVEMVIPLVLGILWFIIRKSQFAYFSALVLIGMLIYIASSNPENQASFMVTGFAICMIYFAAKSQAQVERMDRNFHVMPYMKEYKKIEKKLNSKRKAK